MTDFRVTKRLAALLMAAGFVAGCGTSSPTAINYKSDSRSKQASLAVPPNLLDEASDQRSLPPQGGQATLSDLQQVQKVAPSAPTVVPPVSGMHIQRDGTERWLVIDNKTPDQVWPQIRRFWQEQGFLLVVDARDKGVMETDWNETHPQISDGLIRNTLSKATGNSYVTAERNKYRTRLEVAPSGGTYVFVSQKGMREALTGVNNDSSQWQARPNDPALENEYLKRLMAALALTDSRQASGGSADAVALDKAAPARRERCQVGGGDDSGAERRAVRADGHSERHGCPRLRPRKSRCPRRMTARGCASASRSTGATSRSTIATAPKGIYFVRYVDPKDMTSAEQGFWSQVFHGKKEKVAKQYAINVRAITEAQTRVSIIDDKGQVDSSPQARQIMALLADQIG